MDDLYERGKKIMEGLVEYLVEFAEAFQMVDLFKALESKDLTTLTSSPGR